MKASTLSDQQLSDYFQRINFTGTATNDLLTLQQLHALQPVSIAFENLSSWLGHEVSLQTDAVFDKLVTQQRGGYCFEQNQLFLRVLHTLGFKVQGLSARVLWMLPPDIQLPRTHMAILVTLGQQQYLADVGFGGLTMTAALELHNTRAQSTPHEPFRLNSSHDIFTLSANVAEQWQALYSFSLDPSFLVDYETANWYVATHPQSRFVNQLILGRADNKGRHALVDTRYSRYFPDAAAQVQQVPDPQSLRRILQEQFLLNLNAVPGLDEKLDLLYRTKF